MAAGGSGGFNFSLPATSNTGLSSFGSPSVPAVTTAAAGFSFGTLTSGTSGFNFSTPSSGSGGLNFGTSSPLTVGGSAAASSISGFGNAINPSSEGSIFNTSVTSASSGSASFNLGTSSATIGTAAFGLSNSAVPQVAPSQNSASFSFSNSSGGLNLLNPKPATTAFLPAPISTSTASNNIIAPNASPALNTGGFNFSSSLGVSITNAATNSNAGTSAGGLFQTAQSSSAQSSGATSSLVATVTPTITSSLAPKSVLPSSSVVSGFNFGGSSTSTPLSTISNTTTPVSTSSTPFGGFQLPSVAASTSAPTPSLFSSGSSAFSATGSIVTSSTTPATLSTATTTSSLGGSGSGGGPNLSMRQLEEKLNKWLVELKEQEERFIRQAAHVNAWDQILQNGHDQVQSLKDTLHTVKSDQSRLEAELDFIRGQQEELERLLDPLESAVSSTPATQLHQGDRQRDNMYHLALGLDGQLRQMTDDLGKVIEHLNSGSNSSQPNDPVNLVARILSAHMDSLKWVDQNTALLSQKVEDLSRTTSDSGRRI